VHATSDSSIVSVTLFMRTTVSPTANFTSVLPHSQVSYASSTMFDEAIVVCLAELAGAGSNLILLCTVATAMRNCAEWVITFWAVHLVGAVAVSVNGWLPVKPLMHCLTITSAKVIIVDPERAARIASHISELRVGTSILVAAAGGPQPRLHHGMASFDAVISQYRGPPEAWRSEPEVALDDNATIFFTSGTTGMPKGVLSSQRAFMHGYMVNNFSRDRMMLHFGLPAVPHPTPKDQNAQMGLGVPLMHVTGCGSALMSATYMGFKLVLMRKVSYHTSSV